ncbi:MAG: hypothetical protein H0Z29_04460 [Candidatus Marinimicrobia bacterium]|nr:hypothetical protein [Candidatus Neomarinimicrobiota bacterium]
MSRILSILLVVFNIIYPIQTKYTGEFLKFGAGVREIGLGGAVISNASPATAFYWNPALALKSERILFQVTHTEEFAGIVNYDCVSLLIPGRNGYSYSIGLTRVGVDSIHNISNFIEIQGVENSFRPDYSNMKFFNTAFGALYFSIAKLKSENIYYGVTLKIPFEKLYRARAWGIGIDIGILRNAGMFQIGFVAKDFFTTPIIWDDGEKELILPSYLAGVSIRIKPGKFISYLEPSIGLDFSAGKEENDKAFYLLVGNVRLRFGLEIGIKKNFSLRAGRDDIGDYTVGAGINTNVIKLNYAFGFGRIYRELGNSHRVGLSIDLTEFRKAFIEWLED